MRKLIISLYIFIIIEVLITIFFPEKLPIAVEDAVNNLPELKYTPFIIICLILSCLSVVISIAASVGLYLYKRWAPISALVGTVFGVFVYFIFPVAVYGPISEALGMVGYTLWGAILGLSFSKGYATNQLYKAESVSSGPY